MSKSLLVTVFAVTLYASTCAEVNNFTTNWDASYEEEKASFEKLKKLACKLINGETFDAGCADTIREAIYTHGVSPVFYDNGTIHLLSRYLSNCAKFALSTSAFRDFEREISDAELVALTQLRAQYGA